MNAKAKNDLDIEMVPFERPIVQAVDALVEYAKYKASPNKIIEGETDWQVVEKIFEMFEIFFPKQAAQFAKDQNYVRGQQKNNSIAKEGDAMLQHQLNLPVAFHEMLKAIYPNQTLTKEFVRTLAKRLPQLRVAKR